MAAEFVDGASAAAGTPDLAWRRALRLPRRFLPAYLLACLPAHPLQLLPPRFSHRSVKFLLRWFLGFSSLLCMAVPLQAKVPSHFGVVLGNGLLGLGWIW